MTKKIINQIVQDVAELPDRTSPDNWPEAMLVTADELRSILSRRVTPVECITCSAAGPLHPDGEDHPGWLCPKCYADAVVARADAEDREMHERLTRLQNSDARQ